MIWHRGELHSVGSALIVAAVAGLVATMIGRLLPIGARATHPRFAHPSPQGPVS